MIIHDVEQNSPEWDALRAGIPTASAFDKIITAGGAKSKQSDAYAMRLVAEIMVGGPIKEFEGNGWTERGHELEDEAARLYGLMNDVEPVTVGFITNDDETLGCSPDRVIGGDGLLEIKSPSAHQHMEYLIARDSLKKAYHVQTQGQLFITKREWCDLISYFPALPPAIIRIYPDLDFQMALARELHAFTNRMKEIKGLISDLGLFDFEAANVH